MAERGEHPLTLDGWARQLDNYTIGARVTELAQARDDLLRRAEYKVTVGESGEVLGIVRTDRRDTGCSSPGTIVIDAYPCQQCT